MSLRAKGKNKLGLEIISIHILQTTGSKNKTSQARICTKPNYLTLLTSMFFLFHQQFFLNSSSLSTNRKQTVCTTDRTPTALSIHKVKMHIFVFHQRFQVPPPSHCRHHHHRNRNAKASGIRRSPSCGSCGRRCVLEWCDGPCWVRSCPFWWVGQGVVLLFLIQTDNQLSKLLW